ncbi:hypothetical protein TVAG_403400 [Trichomonas vaginalis G3]|uniref:DUF3447 domain-containing protein n=1 Tax=Trichomonas vaginalis (strain ATCC PRA-98 / G3) TaxID=412133 RepID=A2F8X6_TRIV3|nr:protein ubiquitination [Trichomonas vaginalis G3]EAX98658.1 hypothetical protein TVAG_403400 [Trichomonas vaginalis G3]KAI5508428.1 protein ubiquitination [Trichomonas vaginalis G3]|eukprot:XP_001311588.1 hypothetical protein [Trichomonas vaginalis G3]
MSNQDIHPNKYSELRSICKYYIDSYNALYQLKMEKEEELKSIYKIIKTELIDSNKFPPQMIMKDILNIIPYNNRYTKSYLYLAKLISDDYKVTELGPIDFIPKFLFYKEYEIILGKFEKNTPENLEIHSENTIYRAIMYNDLENFISFTERDGFDKNKRLACRLYPFSNTVYPFSKKGYSLLELCCYHGAVDCFKFLRTKFNSEITETCLEFSFLGGNQEIMSECLKHQKPNKECMRYAIISHNIDFVTFLMNEYKINIDLDQCRTYNNLDALLVYYDQTNDFNKCFVYSASFCILPLCAYFISIGVNINKNNEYGQTALIIAAFYNNKEITELLLSHGANINEKDQNGDTALNYAALKNSRKEIVELLISHGANINETNKSFQTALHCAALKNSRKEIVELLISHGANINEIDQYGRTALHIAAMNKNKETVELLISHGAE